jgi:hypothetical protein
VGALEVVAGGSAVVVTGALLGSVVGVAVAVGEGVGVGEGVVTAVVVSAVAAGAGVGSTTAEEVGGGGGSGVWMSLCWGARLPTSGRQSSPGRGATRHATCRLPAAQLTRAIGVNSSARPDPASPSGAR